MSSAAAVRGSSPLPPPSGSFTKRLAKRSILGTRVVAPGEDGKFYPGIIQAMKTCEDRLAGGEVSRYSVRFDITRNVREFRETEIIGPGFQSVTSSKLKPGQIVYLTHCNREVQGSVNLHRPNIDQVIIQILVRKSKFLTIFFDFCNISTPFGNTWKHLREGRFCVRWVLNGKNLKMFARAELCFLIRVD